MTIYRIVVCAVCVVGCADDDPADTRPLNCPSSGRYLAQQTGSSWTYRVSDADGTTGVKTQTVGNIEDVGGAKAGVMAHRVTTAKPSGMVISWQQDDGASIRRHREQDMSGTVFTDEFYSPFRTRFDGASDHVIEGAKWSESYEETVTETAVPPITVTVSKVESWEVVAVDEDVSVPADHFCALRVRRTSTVNGFAGSDKTFWFVRGVGKVKETGAKQSEELTAYVVAP